MQLEIPESPITRKRELDDALTSRDEVFVLFYASWCPFSRKFLPIFEKAAAGKEGFVRVQDDQETLSDPYHVQIYPTVLFFRKGEVSKRLDGVPRVGLNETLLNDFIRDCRPAQR